MSKKRKDRVRNKRAEGPRKADLGASRGAAVVGGAGAGRFWHNRFFRAVGIFGLLLVLAAAAYINADHDEFLFDSSFARINVPDPGVAFVAHMKRFVYEFWRPGQELALATCMLNAVANRSLGLETYDITSYLAVNVFIHALNAFLVYCLVSALLGRIEPERPQSPWIPLFLAVLFVVHPIHASSVAYIIQRRGTLATMFYILGVLSFLKARRGIMGGVSNGGDTGRSYGKGVKGDRGGWSFSNFVYIAGVPICYWFSYKSKTLGLTFPFVLLAIEFCLRACDRRALRRYLYILLPGLFLSVIGMFGYAWSRGLFDPGRLQVQAWSEGLGWGVWEHFCTESRAFVHYWKFLILPLPRWCSIDHHFLLSRSLFEHYALVAVLFHLFLLVSAVVLAVKRYPLAAAGIFWFYIALIPYIILPQRELLVEYKTYLPSIGLVLIAADVFRYLRGRLSLKFSVPAVVILAAVLLGTTISRNVIYQSQYNLWSDVIKKYPNRNRAHCSLGVIMFNQGKFEEAIGYYKEAIRLAPNYAKAYFNLGNAYHSRNRYKEAVECYEKALELRPKFARGHNEYALLLLELGRHEEAIDHFRLGVEADGHDLLIRINLANTLYERGLVNEAIEQYEKILEFKPRDSDMRNNLATALVRLGKVEKGIEQYRKALDFDEGNAKVHYNLANTLVGREQLDEAIGHYRRALELRSDYVYIHYKLGVALIRKGSVAEGLSLYRRAVEMVPGNAEIRQKIGVELLRVDMAAEAVVYFKEALRINPQYEQARKGLQAALERQGGGG